MNGRWTLTANHRPGCEGAPIVLHGPRVDLYTEVPVVACDDAAVERVAKRICDEGGGWDDGPDEAWDREPEMHETWRALAVEFLTAAAGETP